VFTFFVAMIVYYRKVHSRNTESEYGPTGQPYKKEVSKSLGENAVIKTFVRLIVQAFELIVPAYILLSFSVCRSVVLPLPFINFALFPRQENWKMPI
jgi:hypothetical protein